MRLGADVAPTYDNKEKAVSLFLVVSGLKIITTQAPACLLSSCAKLTYDPKDVFDGRNKYNKQVNQEDENDCNEDVSGPVERFIGEESLMHGPANL